MAIRSLRLRLTLGVVGCLALGWLAVTGAAYFAARHELEELLDADLAQSAATLLARLSDEDGEIELEHLPQVHRYQRQLSFQVWDLRQELRLRSASAPTAPLSAVLEGFSDSEMAGRHWRVFSTRDSRRGLILQVGEGSEARQRVSADIAERLLLLMALALPAMGGVLVLAIGRSLRPLAAVAREVGSRDADYLEAINLHRAPSEVQPILAQLNGLFQRIRGSLENERRFTADAAHELRTPIAAIRAQAQVARTNIQDPQIAQTLDKVLAGCDRASRLTDQLLTLARLDSGGSPATAEVCDLAPLARELLAEAGPAANARGVALEMEAQAPAPVRGEPTLLRVLLRNLVDNAVRYSPPGTRVCVRLDGHGGRTRLEVLDQGPGIPAEEREKVMGRFYRILGSKAPGAGLGLSIVARIVERFGAELSLGEGESGPGLRVTIRFPSTSEFTCEKFSAPAQDRSRTGEAQGK